MWEGFSQLPSRISNSPSLLSTFYSEFTESWKWFLFQDYYTDRTFYPARTPDDAEEEKKVPAVPGTLKKKQRNFAELKIKRLRKTVCPKDALQGKEEASLRTS